MDDNAIKTSGSVTLAYVESNAAHETQLLFGGADVNLKPFQVQRLICAKAASLGG